MLDKRTGAALLAAGVSPTPPGRFLVRRILSQKGHDLTEAARAMDVSVDELGGIVSGHVTVDTRLANRMAVYAGVSAQFWLNMQDAYNLAVEQAKPRSGIPLSR